MLGGRKGLRRSSSPLGDSCRSLETTCKHLVVGIAAAFSLDWTSMFSVLLAGREWTQSFAPNASLSRVSPRVARPMQLS